VITGHAFNRLPRMILGLCALMLLSAAAPAILVGPVTLAPHPLSKMYFTARDVAKQDIDDGGSGALLLLASQSLGTAGTGPALFVQVQSQRSCGSAGCSVSIYLPTKAGWTKILDAVGTLAVLPTVHDGMHDMLVGKGDHWVWNGRAYADTIPAPQVDLTPRNPAPHPHAAPPHRRHATPPKKREPLN
jgi:hypothetical protein